MQRHCAPAGSEAHAATAPTSSLASRQCQAAADEGRSAGATPQRAIPIDQWPSRNGDKSFPLVLHQGTIGKGWPPVVATVAGEGRVRILRYEVVIVPRAITFQPPPLLI
jgi:hypothetical protein